MSPNENKETDDLIKRMEETYFNPKKDKKEKRKKKGSLPESPDDHRKGKIKTFFSDHKKGLRNWGIAALALGGLTWSALKIDFITKRQDYPVRNVIAEVYQTTDYSTSGQSQDKANAGTTTIYQIYRGSKAGTQTKIEDIVASAEYHRTEANENYHLKDQKNNRIANAYFKNERVQAGLSFIPGSVTFKDMYGVVMNLQKNTNADITPKEDEDAFLIYRIEPERGLNEFETNVLRLNGQKKLINRLTESRMEFLGRFWGLNFRRGTVVEHYVAQEDNAKIKEFFDLIDRFNRTKSTDAKERVKLIEMIKNTEAAIPRKPIYKTYEDGIIKLFPQESTIYLCSNPGWWERTGFNIVENLEQLKARLTLGLWPKKVHKEGVLRIENHFDFFPGNIPLLNKLKYSTPTRILSLFDKVNNGGYEIIDNVGTLARVDMQDFWLKYDKDVVYNYYLDKDGNGKIDKTKELIGKVLYHTARKEDSSNSLATVQDRKVLTFMGGFETDSEKRDRDFLMCAYIESMMPDQLNRGYGKHSNLGHINEARSSIILYGKPSFTNLSRAVEFENSLVAAHDIYEVLYAGQRPFAKKFLEKSGVQIHELDQETQQKILNTSIQQK